MNNEPNTIKAGQTIKARSACDHDCVFTAEILERKGNFVVAKAQGVIRRVKVYQDSEGGEYVYALGRYSMAPIFRAK